MQRNSSKLFSRVHGMKANEWTHIRGLHRVLLRLFVPEYRLNDLFLLRNLTIAVLLKKIKGPHWSKCRKSISITFPTLTFCRFLILYVRSHESIVGCAGTERQSSESVTKGASSSKNHSVEKNFLSVLDIISVL